MRLFFVKETLTKETYIEYELHKGPWSKPCSVSQSSIKFETPEIRYQTKSQDVGDRAITISEEEYTAGSLI